MARSMAGQRPDDEASVITLGAPIRGTLENRAVYHAVEAVRERILKEHGAQVLPDCFTGNCTCNFVNCFRRDVSEEILES